MFFVQLSGATESVLRTKDVREAQQSTQIEYKFLFANSDPTNGYVFAGGQPSRIRPRPDWLPVAAAAATRHHQIELPLAARQSDGGGLPKRPLELASRHRRHPVAAFELAAPRADERGQRPQEKQPGGHWIVALLDKLLEPDQDRTERKHRLGGDAAGGEQSASDLE